MQWMTANDREMIQVSATGVNRYEWRTQRSISDARETTSCPNWRSEIQSLSLQSLNMAMAIELQKRRSFVNRFIVEFSYYN